MQAQTVTAITSDSQFNIPEKNGSINFAVLGNYTQATLENGVWTFTDLRLNSSFGLGSRIGTFKASTQDANITIYTCQRTSYGGGTGVLLRYIVSGSGQQTFNFGINLTGGTWMVTFNNDFMAEDNGWHANPSGNVIVNAPSGMNISISYFAFPNDLGNPDTANQPFYQQHSVVIVTGAAAAAILVVAFILTRKTRTNANPKLMRTPNGRPLGQATKNSNPDA